MKKVYDFSSAKRGAVIATPGKTRITIYLDDAVIEQYKQKSEKSGKGYQTLINDALRESLGIEQEMLTPRMLRKILREELAQSA
jgi:uncharacterized protein (DUF4415 family)